MLERLERIVERYARVGIVVDANLLLLFLLGTFDRDQIADFKRTRAYSAEDFDLQRHIAVGAAVTASGFLRLGLTDAAIEQVAAEDHPVLTDDLDLYLHLSRAATNVFNFNHLRQLLLM